MIRKIAHIVLLVCLVSFLCGCAREAVPFLEEPGIQLTVRCVDPVPTKAGEERNGEASFNENLIQSVDFLFYPGDHPDADADAVYHVRKEVSQNTIQAGLGEAPFTLVVKKDVIGQIFLEGNGFRATVYALVNFDADFIEDLSQTSHNELAARRIVTDFAAEEYNFVQSKFLMDGETVIQYDEDATPNANGEITVTRFAAKLSVAVNLPERVELKHEESTNEPIEVWTPVPHTMRIYLVWGVKSVLLGDLDPNPEYFDYSDGGHQRAYKKESGDTYFDEESVTVGSEVRKYMTTWPMYSYPANWSGERMNYSDIEYSHSKELPPEPPYFKLEMDWRREPENGYSYDRRKYYYKVFMPFDEFKRNNWYGFYLDVSILGSETDEGKVTLDPTCYLLDWQNKSLAINKYAVISKARYLSVDKSSWDINNLETLSIPFLSSHNVAIVPGSVTATRPFYGEIKDHPVNKYDTKLHAYVRKVDGEDSYYLDYNGQPEGNEKYEPSGWISNTSTAIELHHALQNEYAKDDFDYSPYTIDFDIIHSDLVDEPESHTYSQYIRHITIVQRPAIYIERLRNRDTAIIPINSDNPYGYSDGEAPWWNKPWGYVYVNGGRFVRWDKKAKASSDDPFFKLTEDSAKREYQWQTVWYTGGSTDMYDIHVTVLPPKSNFVIGDPRVSTVNNLDNEAHYPGLYVYTVEGATSQDVWNNLLILSKISDKDVYLEKEFMVYQRVGFNKAAALYGDSPRSLTWYYPTDKTTRTENMVAPSYRFASKFGGTEYGNGFFADITKEYAEYRCAAYQEDGFPAGRWRLPTKAEINFIAQLSAKKAFEPLFSNATYWSANGAITVSSSSGTVTNSSSERALLRCVYDSWYWDKVDGREGDPRRPDNEVFYWGDKER